MSKKHKKNLKAHIFNSLQQAEPATSNTVTTAPREVKQEAPVFATSANTAHKYDVQFSHVGPDLKFFYLMVLMMAVVLGVVYYLDQSQHIVLTLGQKLYSLLQIK